MKTKLRMLVSLLCALTLLLGVLPLSTVSAESPPDNGRKNIEAILERDGYLEGIWYPWFDWYQIGCNLYKNSTMESMLGSQWWKGQSQYQGGLDRYGVEQVYCDLVNMKAIGYNIIGFNGSMQGEGVIYDNNGDVLGIEEEHLRNIRRFLDICREVGMSVMWNAHFHSEGLLDDYKDGYVAYSLMTQMYSNPTVTEHYVERYIRPLCKLLAQYPDVVVMFSAMDESDNEVNDSANGQHFAIRQDYGVTEKSMVNFITRITETAREELPGVAMTLASNGQDFTRYIDLDLDFMGRSMYGNGTGFDDAEQFFSTAPLLATEFGLGDKVTEEQYSSIHLEKRTNMMKEGYKGWFMWIWQTYVGGGHYDVMLQDSKHCTDLRPMVFDLHYYILDYRAKHQGKTVTLDAPAMFYNGGDGKVVWISSRQATKMSLLRSDDGGKTWKTLLNNVNPKQYVDANGKGVYLDTTAPADGYCYKIEVQDAKGNKATSNVTNCPEDAAEFFASKDYSGKQGGAVYTNPPKMPNQATENAKGGALTLSTYGVEQNRPVSADVNLLKDGSFESGLGGFASSSVLKVVSDSTAPEGSKSLFYDTSKTATAAWQVFWVEVQPNTTYTFSAWVKGAFIADDNRYCASIGVVDPDTKQYLVYSGRKTSTTTRQIVPTSWDNQWHLRSVTFNSGSKTKVGIALYGHSSKLWVDGMALYTTDKGVKYQPTTTAVTVKMDDGSGTCPDAKNLITDPYVNKTNYWQEGSGFGSGFMSVGKSDADHGTSLRYKEGEKNGVYYVKWIDVQPNTDYVFSMHFKVLNNGDGYLALAARDANGPSPILIINMDKDIYGEDWLPFHIRFNSGSYTRIAIAVCDRGGEALMDNLRVYRYGDADPVTGDTDTTTPSITIPTVASTTKKPTTEPTKATSAAGSVTTTAVGGVTETDPTQSGSETTTTVTDAVDGTDPTSTTASQPAAEDVADTDGDAEPKPEKAPWLLIGIIGAVVVIGGGIALFLFLRKKKA